MYGKELYKGLGAVQIQRYYYYLFSRRQSTNCLSCTECDFQECPLDQKGNLPLSRRELWGSEMGWCQAWSILQVKKGKQKWLAAEFRVQIQILT